MKPVFSLILMMLFLWVLPSCKKDWECLCTDSNGHKETTSLSKLTKRDAQVACELLTTNDLNCEIK